MSDKLIIHSYKNLSSNIHGKGRFSIGVIKSGELIQTISRAIYDNKNDGGYNHSCSPNAKLVNDGGAIAIKDIAAEEEITVDYGWGKKGFLNYCNCPTCGKEK